MLWNEPLKLIILYKVISQFLVGTMPGDISKHAKYKVDLPYPEAKVEQKNIYYAKFTSFKIMLVQLVNLQLSAFIPINIL